MRSNLRLRALRLQKSSTEAGSNSLNAVVKMATPAKPTHKHNVVRLFAGLCKESIALTSNEFDNAVRDGLENPAKVLSEIKSAG